MLCIPVMALSSEEDERVRKKTEEAIKYAGEHSDRGEMSNERLLGLTGSALELLGGSQNHKPQRRSLEIDDPKDWRNQDIVEVLGSFFK